MLLVAFRFGECSFAAVAILINIYIYILLLLLVDTFVAINQPRSPLKTLIVNIMKDNYGIGSSRITSNMSKSASSSSGGGIGVSSFTATAMITQQSSLNGHSISLSNGAATSDDSDIIGCSSEFIKGKQVPIDLSNFWLIHY